MPSLVLVCHSANLAIGLRELVEQITQGRVPVFATGGADDQTLGTNPDRIRAALDAADNPEGVLVLMDLGSSVLGAEMVVSDWPAERRARVVLCEAPLVEGAVAAAAQMAAGATLQEAANEARTALAPKAAQLGVEPPAAVPLVPPPSAGGVEVTVTVPNPMGLHARPAAFFVRTAARFKAQIGVRNTTRGRGPVSAKSAIAVALLDARQGDQIAISGTGPDGEQAVAALRDLVASGFGEGEALAEAPVAAGPAAVAAPGALAGIPASPGIAIGPARVFRPPEPVVEVRTAEDPEAEWRRVRDALTRAREEVAAIRQQAAARLGEYQAAIFDAHLLFLEDPELIELVRRRIFDDRLGAEAAWQAQVRALAARYDASDNPYLRARAADIHDIGVRVLRLLVGAMPMRAPALEQPAVLVAPDLSPSQVASLEAERTLAICTAGGGPTSHSAVLARRLGIPGVVALGEAIMEVRDGALLVVDGAEGRVFIEPEPHVRETYRARREAWLASQAATRLARLEPAVTRDGRRVEIAANVGSAADARAAVEYGAEGIGLLRTEFLYLDRQTAPSEDEQADAYRAILRVAGSRPVIVRTFDVGGDKPVRYLDLEPEANPFLGLRGIRLGLQRPELLKAQLRAILRAGAGFAVKVMFPMVATVDEVRRARVLLDEACRELKAEGRSAVDCPEVGVMIEVPSAALMAAELAPVVDFFSIGTNDLTQYTLAADRANPRTAALADGLHPAVLRLIKQVADAAHRRGRWVGVCGELAADLAAVPILIGLSVDELSMNPPAIPEVKTLIRRLEAHQARTLAETAIMQDSPAAVRGLMRRVLEDLSHGAARASRRRRARIS